jgi:uncharacterized membrane protein YkoI
MFVRKSTPAASLRRFADQNSSSMKAKHSLHSLAIGALLALALTGCATHEQTEAELSSQAKISRADAERTALMKVPGGSVKEGELEREHGKLIWSFDIASAGSGVTEVHVDAITGAVVSVEHESASAEAKEKK